MSSQIFEYDKNIDPEVNERYAQTQPLAEVLGNQALTHPKSIEEL